MSHILRIFGWVTAGAAVALLFVATVAFSRPQSQSTSVVMSPEASKRALSKGEVSLDAAMKIVKGCEDFAAQNNVVAATYVLDPFGNIVFAHRMDGIRPIESEAARARAKAALFNRGASGGGGGNANANPGAGIVGQIRVQMRGQQQAPGGYPIIVDDEVVGSVGVATSGTVDADCARAGLAEVGLKPPAPPRQPFNAPQAPATRP